MDSKNMQRISLYLDRKTVKTADLFIKQHGYRSRNEFFTDAVENMAADSMLKSKNDLISKKLANAVANLSEDNAKAISKGLFRYAVQLEMVMRIIAQLSDFTDDELEEMRKEAINNVRRTRGKVHLDEIIKGYYNEK